MGPPRPHPRIATGICRLGPVPTGPSPRLHVYGNLLNGMGTAAGRTPCTKPIPTRQAETGIHTIMFYLLEHVHCVWLARNLALHGDDTATQLLSYRHTQLLLNIQDLYDQQESMLAADRQIFTKPYEYWLDKPTSQLKTFRTCTRTTVKTSILQAKDMGKNFRTIDSYFPPPIPQHVIDAIHLIPYFPPEPD